MTKVNKYSRSLKTILKKQFLAIKLFLILIAFVSLFLVYYSYVIKKQRNELQVRIENCEKIAAKLNGLNHYV